MVSLILAQLGGAAGLICMQRVHARDILRTLPHQLSLLDPLVRRAHHSCCQRSLCILSSSADAVAIGVLGDLELLLQVDQVFLGLHVGTARAKNQLLLNVWLLLVSCGRPMRGALPSTVLAPQLLLQLVLLAIDAAVTGRHLLHMHDRREIAAGASPAEVQRQSAQIDRILATLQLAVGGRSADVVDKVRAWCLARRLLAAFVMKTIFILKLINLLLLLGRGVTLAIRILPRGYARILARYIFDRRQHLWVIKWLQLTISEHVHLLAHRRLYSLELALLNELGEGVDLLLVEESDEIVAEPAHLGVSVDQQLLDVPLLAHLLHLISSLESLELARSLCEGSLSRLLFEYQNHERALFLALGLLGTAVEKDWHLVDLQHDVGEEKLVAILRLRQPLRVISSIVRLLILAAALVQVNSIAQSIITSFDLPNRLVKKAVEATHAQIV